MARTAHAYADAYPRISRIDALREELRDLNEKATALEDNIGFSSMATPSRLQEVYEARRDIMRAIDAASSEAAFS